MFMKKLQCSFKKETRYYDKNAQSLTYEIGSLVPANISQV